MSVMTDLGLQAAPATKARGYWATVGRRHQRATRSAWSAP